MFHTYKLAGFNIVVDSASASIHSVDEVAYDAICFYGNEGREAALERIAEKYRELEESEIIELVADIEGLERQGKLFSTDTFAGIANAASAAPLKALCMNVSHLCNMSCSYCFAGCGGYGGDGALMPIETGVRAIDYLIENSGSRKNIDVDFFGGEPLLNWGVVKGIVDYARKEEQGSGKQFRFTLTTNGLLIDDDVIDFTNREMHNVVLSLDGRPEVNDAARKLNDGGGSYAAVVPKIKKIVEARNGKDYYIRGTYTRANLDFLKDILHIADIGFTELSMEPAVAKRCVPHGLTMNDLPELFKQYEKLAMEMLRRNKERRGFSFYHFKLDLTGGPCVHKRLSGCGVGTEYLAVTPAGELYPCHQFIGDREFLMGDVWRGLTDNHLAGEFCKRGIYSRFECRECWARLYCSGGCAANAYNDTGSLNSVHAMGCELFKKRLECAIMIKVAEAVT